MLDSFTAALLLESAKNDSDSIASMYKEIMSKDDGEVSPKLISFIESKIGAEVRIAGTSHVGTVHRANKATCGFWPGNRYPVYVKITESLNPVAVGEIFEYCLDQIIVTLENGAIIDYAELFKYYLAGIDDYTKVMPDHTAKIIDYAIKKKKIATQNSTGDLCVPTNMKFENGVTMVEVDYQDGAPLVFIPFTDITF